MHLFVYLSKSIFFLHREFSNKIFSYEGENKDPQVKCLLLGCAKSYQYEHICHILSFSQKKFNPTITSKSQKSIKNMNKGNTAKAVN
jgi:hypothetical protein